MKDSNLVRSECSNNTMKDTAIMEEHKIVLLPIMWINQLFRLTNQYVYAKMRERERERNSLEER